MRNAQKSRGPLSGPHVDHFPCQVGLSSSSLLLSAGLLPPGKVLSFPHHLHTRRLPRRCSLPSMPRTSSSPLVGLLPRSSLLQQQPLHVAAASADPLTSLAASSLAPHHPSHHHLSQRQPHVHTLLLTPRSLSRPDPPSLHSLVSPADSGDQDDEP